jgi:arylsulfatase A-like enzyme
MMAADKPNIVWLLTDHHVYAHHMRGAGPGPTLATHDRIAARGEPFCLRVDVWGPHQPYYVAPPFAGSIDPRQIPEYPTFSHTLADRPASHRRFRDGRHESASIHSWDQWQPVVARCYEHATQVDAALGRVVDALDRLGLAEDTLVIYTADHGDAIAAAGGVFDKDSLMIEETSRIPLAMRWDGAEADWDEELMCQHHGHGSPHFQRLLRYGPYKYVAHLDEEDELYDLSRDPYERKNLAPRETMRGVLADMPRRLAGQMDRYDDNAEDAGRLKRDFL